jgi:cell wall-associated NlpC family hydrolase
MMLEEWMLRRSKKPTRLQDGVLLRTTLAVLAAVAGLLLVSSPGYGATSSRHRTASSGPQSCARPKETRVSDAATGSEKATKAELAAIESAIAAEQLCVTDLSEEYDEATYRLGQLDGDITETRTEIGQASENTHSAMLELRTDALNAYMYDEPPGQIQNLFEGTTVTSLLQSQYTSDALGNISGALTSFRSDEEGLEQTQSLLVAERARAEAQAKTAKTAALEATAESAAAEQILTRVKGRLAAQVAQAAALQAEHDAAEVASAATARAKEAAALQAELAAQVAQTLGSGSSSASAAGKAAGAAGAGSGGSGTPPSSLHSNSKGEIAVETAESFIGVPYVWGGASRSGVDCSGLTMLSWEAAGVSLAHSAAIQETESTPVPLSELEPGDLLFYDFDGAAGIDHVVMYVGSGPYGIDTIIQAAHTGTYVSFDPIWFQGLVGAGMP